MHSFILIRHILHHKLEDIMRGKYYQRTESSATINIVMKKGDIPFENTDDLIVQYDSKRGLLIMKQSDAVKL